MAEHAPGSVTERGHIRTLTAMEMPLLREHLLRLDAESRRDRFNGTADERFIESYAARCTADGTVVIAYVDDGKVLGAAELHQPGSSPDGVPEIAFSVEREIRRRGVGSILFRRLIAEAEGRGYDELRITTGYGNDAMRALAQKFGARLSFKMGESTGTIDLREEPIEKPEATPQPGSSKSAAHHFDPARTMLDLNRTWWREFLRLSGWERLA